MNVLLIYPPYIHSTAHDTRSPAMSLAYIGAVLESRGHSVTVYDASLGPVEPHGRVFRYGDRLDEIRRRIAAVPFDLVGISCTFAARWRFTKEVAAIAKEIRPGAPVALGGLFATYRAAYCLETCPSVDFVMLGEAETGFAEVVDRLAAGTALDEILVELDGTAGRAPDGSYRCRPKVAYNERLDDLPFPAWHLYDLDRYFAVQKNIFELSPPCLPILSSRSCPYRCRFCDMHISHGSKWRARSAESVVAEMEHLVGRFGVRRFYFADDNFAHKPERAKEICRAVIAKRLDIRFNCFAGLSIRTVDRDLAFLMKKAGCSSVCLAVESGSERVRNEIYGKRLEEERIQEAFRFFREAGIPTIAYFIVGGPGETRADFEATKRLVARLPMSLLTVNVFAPYPGTELYEECRRKGWLIDVPPEEDERIEMFSAMIRTPDFTPDEIGRWQRELYSTFVRTHWPGLVREFLRPSGLVGRDAIGKALGMFRFRRGDAPASGRPETAS